MLSNADCSFNRSQSSAFQTLGSGRTLRPKTGEGRCSLHEAVEQSAPSGMASLDPLHFPQLLCRLLTAASLQKDRYSHHNQQLLRASRLGLTPTSSIALPFKWNRHSPSEMPPPKHPWKRLLWENTLLPFIPEHWPVEGSGKSQPTFTTAEVNSFPRAVSSMNPTSPAPSSFTQQGAEAGTQCLLVARRHRIILQKLHTPLSVTIVLPASHPLSLAFCLLSYTDAPTLKKPPQKSPPSALLLPWAMVPSLLLASVLDC